MTARQDPISRWRSRLAESEERLSGGSDRFQWARKIYVRVYRFLLSSYGQEEREFEPDNVDEEPATSAIPHRRLACNVRVLGGGEPKTARRIRDTLDRVHGANEQPTSSGPLAKGLDKGAWIVVASELARVSPERCKKLLLNKGIDARVVRRGDDRMVEVPLEDRETAFGLIRQNRSELRTIARRRRSRWLGAICGGGFGAFMFTLLSFAAALGLTAPPASFGTMTFALTGGVFGALAGWLFGVSTIRRV